MNGTRRKPVWGWVSGGLVGMVIGCGLFAAYLFMLDSKVVTIRQAGSFHFRPTVWGLHVQTVAAIGLLIPLLSTALGVLVSLYRPSRRLMSRPVVAGLALASFAVLAVCYQYASQLGGRWDWMTGN